MVCHYVIFLNFGRQSASLEQEVGTWKTNDWFTWLAEGYFYILFHKRNKGNKYYIKRFKNESETNATNFRCHQQSTNIKEITWEEF